MLMSQIIVGAVLCALTIATTRWFWCSGSWTSYAVSLFCMAATIAFSGTALILWLSALKAGVQ